jgi:hypothetical protein
MMAPIRRRLHELTRRLGRGTARHDATAGVVLGVESVPDGLFS